MAVFPCDFSAHRYPQAQQSLYVTYVMEGLVQTSQIRLCPTHFSRLLELTREEMAELEDSSVYAKVCCKCGHDTSCSIYVKVFAAKSDMTQYAVDLCGVHGEELLRGLKFGSGRALTAR